MPKGRRSFECDVCQKIFYQRSNLKRHMVTHTGEKPFQCEVCLKSFTQSSHLKTHFTTHMQYSEKPYQCDLCQRMFSQASHLKSHMLTHPKKMSFQCDMRPNRLEEASTEANIEESVESVSFGGHFMDSEDSGWPMVVAAQSFDTNAATESGSEAAQEILFSEECPYPPSQTGRRRSKLDASPLANSCKDEDYRLENVYQSDEESENPSDVKYNILDEVGNELAVCIWGDEELEELDLLYLEDKTLMKLFRERETDKTSLSIVKAFLSDGMIRLIANNEETVQWMLKEIPSIEPRKSGTRYRIFRSGHGPLCFVAKLTHQRSATDANVFDFLLRRANPKLPRDEIKVLGIVKEEDKEEDNLGILIRIMFHRNHLGFLKKSNFKLLFGWSKLELKGPAVVLYTEKRRKTTEDSLKRISEDEEVDGQEVNVIGLDDIDR